ncbi:hypothetical protein PV327_011067 [Microctonus hyperodae]|uniref:Uncharacterized protein n=1 Tax=Microctonus hyperodae TaxID=165561 RepID=A0AA39KUD4_MICHY|nr:hypothetical protein PV327_011067 [Microctonus hyperodae]
MSDDDRQSSIHDGSQDGGEGGEGCDGSTTSLHVDQSQTGTTPAIVIENAESTSVPTQQSSTQHDPSLTQRASTRPLTRTPERIEHSG